MKPNAGGLCSVTRVASKVQSFMCSPILSSARPQELKARHTRTVSPSHSGLKEGNLLAATSFLQIKPEVGRFELILKKKTTLPGVGRRSTGQGVGGFRLHSQEYKVERVDTEMQIQILALWVTWGKLTP